MKTAAVQLSKICNDLRWLASGQRCGLYELRLPAMQPGSSIMPGKVNPVIPEVVNQVCFQIIGVDVAISNNGTSKIHRVPQSDGSIALILEMSDVIGPLHTLRRTGTSTGKKPRIVSSRLW